MMKARKKGIFGRGSLKKKRQTHPERERKSCAKAQVGFMLKMDLLQSRIEARKEVKRLWRRTARRKSLSRESFQWIGQERRTDFCLEREAAHHLPSDRVVAPHVHQSRPGTGQSPSKLGLHVFAVRWLRPQVSQSRLFSFFGATPAYIRLCANKRRG